MRSIIAILLTTAALPLSAQAPTLVVLNAKVFTADSAAPWAEALAVRGDRIIAVGSSASVRALQGATTKVINARGRTLIPGLNDAHVHMGLAPWFTVAPAGQGMPPDPSASEILEAVSLAAKGLRRGEVIRVIIGPTALDDTTLRRVRLDAASPNHGVILSVWSGHGVILNSRLLRRTGIDTITRDPLGGSIERDAAGHPTGLVHEYGWWIVEQRMNAAQPFPVLLAAHRAYARRAMALGITSVQNMAGALDPGTTLRVACAANIPLRVRLIAFPMTTVRGRLSDQFPAQRCPGAATAHVTVGGVKYILDGTPVERRAVERAPYADRPTSRGSLNFPPDTLAAILQAGLDRRSQVLLHAVGDSAVRLVLTTMQRLAPAERWRPLRVRLEHGDGLAVDLLPLARDLGVVLVQNPLHLALGPLKSQRFAPERLPNYQPLRSALLGGVALALGSDGEPNPFLDLMLATMHPNTPSEAITLEQALTAYTAGSAFAEGKELEKGRIAVGMLADFALLSQDIFSVPPQALPATTSVLTVIGGVVGYERSAGGRRTR